MSANIVNISAVCRTCEETSRTCIKLTTRNEKHPEKTLSDMLLELAKIDSNVGNSDTLPQQVCQRCFNRLKDAFDFVLQARQVNQRLMANIENVCCKENLDCLVEAPIDISSHDFLEIKMEIEGCTEDEPPNFPDTNIDEGITNVDTTAPKDEYTGDENEDDDDDEWRLSDDNSNADYNYDENIKDSNFERGRNVSARRLRSSRSIPPVKRFKKNQKRKTDESDSDDDYVPQKRRRGRPRSSKRLSNNAGRFVCDTCGKTFAWHKDVLRHAKSHSSEVKFMCDSCGKGFYRKDKYMNHMRKHTKESDVKGKKRTNFCDRLYSAKRFKLLECRLCVTRFSTTEELLLHLITHKNIESLKDLTMDNLVIKEFYANGDIPLTQIKETICEEIAALQYNKYCLLINEYGYEMSFDDSDEDSPTGYVKYVCELCGENFTRKYQTLLHAHEKHKQDAMPYRCNVCKLFFISEQLFEQHTRTQCRNRDKKYKCLKCPGKFMWAENLDQHKCADNVKKSDSKDDQESKDDAEDEMIVAIRNKASYQCCLCIESFEHFQQLRTHLMVHSDGVTKVDFEYATFFKCYYPSGCVGKESELSKQIEADFIAQNYTLFYSALSRRGLELNLYDSDSSTENEDLESTNEREQQKTSYVCGICGETRNRRTYLLNHQKSQHGDHAQSLPFACEKCNKQYVCAELLEQHQLRDCLNRHKTIQCEKCDARFVWQNNFETHQRMNHMSSEKLDEKLAKKLQCDQCDKVFIWPKDLTRHKRVHLPDTEKYECPFCERKFVRKDNMQSHIKVHSEEAKRSKPVKVKSIDSQRCKPHGCKRIECMICHTQHQKISDLKTHLNTHQFVVDFNATTTAAASAATGTEDDTAAIEAISSALYPEEEKALTKPKLITRIMSDIAKKQYERFYSITNEAGYELSLDSTETETDSESEFEQNKNTKYDRKYSCEVCAYGFIRKYQLYEHQQTRHQWNEANHICVHCQARFISSALLEHHTRTLCRNALKRFICRKCPQRFRWKENFKAHSNTHCDIGDVRQPSTIFECLECNRVFQMQKDLTRHMFMHSRDSAIFACQWCPRKFYRRGNLTQHLERHGIAPHELSYAESLINLYKYANGKKVILCIICNIKFERISELRAHLKDAPSIHHNYDSMLNYTITNQLGFELHLEDSETDDEKKIEDGTPVYTCELCQLVCRRKHELFRHQHAMHKMEKIELKCTHCVFKSVSKDLLAYHKRTQCENKEKQLVCSGCNLKFMWQDNLTQHLQLHHSDNGSAPELKSEITENEKKQIFQCAHCPCKYNRKDRLNAHVKKIHGIQGGGGASASVGGGVGVGGSGKAIAGSSTSRKNVVEISAEEKMKKADGKRFLCAFCGKAVSSSSNLIIHMRRHTGEKPFKCDFCEMAFARSSDMQCHRRTHTGERPYKCTVCEKAFSRSYKLHQHMRIHNGERPYKCTYCEKSFTQSNDLTLHIRRHTGERPYVCGICGEGFIQGTALKNHRIMRGHTEENTQPLRRTKLEQFSVS